jgi:uncharacterized membrane protein YsdA (DUF1294 family)
MNRVHRSWSPETVHGVLGLTMALTLALGLVLVLHLPWSPGPLFFAWLVGINLITFGYFAVDKSRAISGGARVPEVVLQGLALAGGTLGAMLAMRLFRHKTVKRSFRLLFGGVVVVQGILLVWWALAFFASLLVPLLVGVAFGALLAWWAFSGVGRRRDATAPRSRLAGGGTKVQ